MVNTMNNSKIHHFANSLGLLCISIVLTAAFYDQLTYHDLPCPLCLLQRASFIGVGLCLMANLAYGLKVRHYGLALLFAISGEVSSLRQIFLHIVPGQPGYGLPFFGLHLYSISALLFFALIGLFSIGLTFDRGLCQDKRFTFALSQKINSGIFLTIILLNALSAFLICGLSQCPDDPTQYLLLAH